MPSFRHFSLTVLLVASTAAAQQPQYPTAAKGDVVDDYFGRKVADPYRWMEELDAPATKAWVQAENTLTFGYLAGIKVRDSIRARLTTLWNFPRVSVPAEEAGQIWFRRNTGLQRQSALFRAATRSASPTVVLDPNTLFPDGATAVSQWSVSPDGKLLAYTTAVGGSDLRDIRLRDLATGKDLPEVVARVKFTGISWTRDGAGFYYSRYRGSASAANLKDANLFHQVWYHSLGGKPERMIFDRPDDSTAGVGGTVSDDGRWLFLSSSSGTSNNRLWIADLKDARHPDLAARAMPVTTAEDADYNPLGVVGQTLYLFTNWQAPNGRIVTAAVGDSDRTHWRTVVAEGHDVMNETALVGTRLIVGYLVDVQSRVRLYDLSGAPQGEIQLPDIGSASGITGRTDGNDLYFAFSSYLRPTTIYHYDLRIGVLEPFQAAPTPFDATPFETRATFYQSKDGTRVPIFIMAKKGLALDGSHPTLLYGYGGFDISLTPSYSPATAAWLELGGVYAVANLRGGGEYGEAWHHAGWKEKKQNVFDDFIAAAEFLEHEGYATPRTLAIQGGSNGGLLVGAAMTQRPELFGVALPAVGVMDMLRYDHFTGGHFWTIEYGSSSDSAAVGRLLAYSPLHNLKAGTCYPATLVTTADHDDRVVPSHSFKFAATLQAAQGCRRPVMIRVETAGSHGYRPTDRVIAEIADEFAFALANIGTGVP